MEIRGESSQALASPWTNVLSGRDQLDSNLYLCTHVIAVRAAFHLFNRLCTEDKNTALRVKRCALKIIWASISVGG